MPTTLTNGIQLPDKGSVDWYSSMQSNYNLIDTHLGNTDIHVTAEDKANWDSKQGSLSQAQLDAIAQVAINTDDIATLQSDKANASHTHSSSDITDIDDYATKQYVDTSISDLVDNAPDALNTLNELSAALNDDSNFATTVTNALANKANSADLATVATSGSYIDLTDKPTINDSTITIQKNGSTVDTFTTNGSDKTINITVPTETSDLNNDSGFITLNDVPTKTSDLTNDSDFVVSSSLATVATSGFYNDLDNKPYIPDKISDLIDDSNFVDTSNPAVSSGITSAKVTDYDAHIADTDIHVTASDKTSWNTVTSKANDSDVVHKSGNETVGGQKTFDSNTYVYNSDNTATTPNLILKNSKSSKGSTSETGAQLLKFADKNNSIVSELESIVTTDGTSELRLRSNTLNSNNQNVQTGITLISNTNGAKRFCPTSNNDVFLGASTLKWARVYATNYYYGNDNVEFSNKFVTTDTAQTVSGAKTFSENIVISNSDTSQNSKRLVIRSSKVNLGDSNSDSWGISFNAGASYAAVIDSEKSYNSMQGLSFSVRTKDDNNNLISASYKLRIYTDGSANLIPNETDSISLGSSSNKWENTCTNLINGVEPSSLSLPSGNVSDMIDISSYISDLSGTNLYTPPANGYITFSFASGAQVQIYPASGMGLCSKWVAGSSSGIIRGFIPVLKNTAMKISVNATTMNSFYFIPCQGNV